MAKLVMLVPIICCNSPFPDKQSTYKSGNKTYLNTRGASSSDPVTLKLTKNKLIVTRRKTCKTLFPQSDKTTKLFSGPKTINSHKTINPISSQDFPTPKIRKQLKMLALSQTSTPQLKKLSKTPLPLYSLKKIIPKRTKTKSPSNKRPKSIKNTLFLHKMSTKPSIYPQEILTCDTKLKPKMPISIIRKNLSITRKNLSTILNNQ
jgi:hypothetical protein